MGEHVAELDEAAQETILDWCEKVADERAPLPLVPQKGEGLSDELVEAMDQIMTKKVKQLERQEVNAPKVTPSKDDRRVAAEMREVAKIPPRLFQAYGAMLEKRGTALPSLQSEPAESRKLMSQDNLDALAERSVSQHRAMLIAGFGPLTEDHLRRLSPAQIAILSNKQISMIHPQILSCWNLEQVRSLSTDQIEAMSLEQNRALFKTFFDEPVESVTWEKLKSLTPDQLNAVYVIGVVLSKKLQVNDPALRQLYQTLAMVKLGGINEEELRASTRPADVYASFHPLYPKLKGQRLILLSVIRPIWGEIRW